MKYDESDLKSIKNTMGYLDKAMSSIQEMKESGIFENADELNEMSEMIGNINSKIHNMTSKNIGDEFLLESFDIQDEEDDIDLLFEEI